MIALDELRTVAPEDTADKLAYVVHALIRTARLALENDTSGQDAGWSACVTLELAEELMMPLGEGCEALSRATGRGWARDLLGDGEEGESGMSVDQSKFTPLRMDTP